MTDIMDQPIDDLIEESKKLIKEKGRVSTSMIQRNLRIGYVRAARIIDIMEERGLISGVRGSELREIYF